MAIFIFRKACCDRSIYHTAVEGTSEDAQLFRDQYIESLDVDVNCSWQIIQLQTISLQAINDLIKTKEKREAALAKLTAKERKLLGL